MYDNTSVFDKCKEAKSASPILASSSSFIRNKALEAIASSLKENCDAILEENKKDIEKASENGVKDTMIDRLTLTSDRVFAIANSVLKLVALPDVLGNGTVSVRPNGLKITKVHVPLGTVGIIYEARPNVTADAAAICIKTGNTVVLRGGKEAFNSNRKICEIMRQAIAKAGLPKGCICFIDDPDRQSSIALMNAVGLIDVLIPRGGKGLIKAVCENASVPVIETGAGNCHVYVEKNADIPLALSVCINAKVSRPSVCNAAETLLCDEDIAKEFLPLFKAEADKYNVELRGCEKTLEILPDIKKATDEDFYTEYNDYIMSVKIVSDVKEATEHINKHSTHHSEAIMTENVNAADYFKTNIDSAAVYVNASTRFTDGEEFGFGAEIGISTQKMHARGPMGPEQLTSIKYIIEGKGQIR